MTPALHTGDLRGLLRDYCGALGFAPVQYVPGVFALCALGSARLQLWQRAGWQPPARGQALRVTVAAGVFGLYARMAPAARGRLVGPPALEPWGAWEFTLHDVQGNRLTFVEWAVPLPQAVRRAPRPAT